MMLRKEMLPPRFFVGSGLYSLALYLMWKHRLATIGNGLALAIIFNLFILIPFFSRWVFPKNSNKSR
jgi:hypothetical protein